MKLTILIWILAVFVREVVPGTIIRHPRDTEPDAIESESTDLAVTRHTRQLAKSPQSSVQTEYEAKYQQKGHCGNESFATVKGKQEIVHNNCSDNWNEFAEKCATLIKDLVASLANAISSNPGDTTNLQLQIKNSFRHFDSTNNCSCFGTSNSTLSNLGLALPSLFNKSATSITLTTHTKDYPCSKSLDVAPNTAAESPPLGTTSDPSTLPSPKPCSGTFCKDGDALFNSLEATNKKSVSPSDTLKSTNILPEAESMPSLDFHQKNHECKGTESCKEHKCNNPECKGTHSCNKASEGLSQKPMPGLTQSHELTEENVSKISQNPMVLPPLLKSGSAEKDSSIKDETKTEEENDYQYEMPQSTEAEEPLVNPPIKTPVTPSLHEKEEFSDYDSHTTQPDDSFNYDDENEPDKMHSDGLPPANSPSTHVNEGKDFGLSVVEPSPKSILNHPKSQLDNKAKQLWNDHDKISSREGLLDEKPKKVPVIKLPPLRYPSDTSEIRMPMPDDLTKSPNPQVSFIASKGSNTDSTEIPMLPSDSAVSRTPQENLENLSGMLPPSVSNDFNADNLSEDSLALKPTIEPVTECPSENIKSPLLDPSLNPSFEEHAIHPKPKGHSPEADLVSSESSENYGPAVEPKSKFPHDSSVNSPLLDFSTSPPCPKSQSSSEQSFPQQSLLPDKSSAVPTPAINFEAEKNPLETSKALPLPPTSSSAKPPLTESLLLDPSSTQKLPIKTESKPDSLTKANMLNPQQPGLSMSAQIKDPSLNILPQSQDLNKVTAPCHSTSHDQGADLEVLPSRLPPTNTFNTPIVDSTPAPFSPYLNSEKSDPNLSRTWTEKANQFEDNSAEKATTFQTTSIEPTPALGSPALQPPSHVSSTCSYPKPFFQPTVQEDSEMSSTEPSNLKPPRHDHHHDHDDDEDSEDYDDCCSCESCTDEESKSFSPRQFRTSACKDLEDAKRELKAIFDKIKKKLKCGRKAPKAISASAAPFTK